MVYLEILFDIIVDHFAMLGSMSLSFDNLPCQFVSSTIIVSDKDTFKCQDQYFVVYLPAVYLSRDVNDSV